MRLKKIGNFFSFLFLFTGSVLSQKGAVIKGVITSAKEKEPLVGVIVQDTLSKRYTTSDGYGVFSLAVPDDEACLFFQYAGYESHYLCDTFDDESVLEVDLETANYLPEIEVTSSYVQQRSGTSIASLPISTVELLPQIGGEVDLLKTIALMPGVSLGVEGSTGLYIRGGSPDQNLILLDEAPVYNISHFGSFLSVFNTDAIKHFEIIKGGWPAQYGGRLSGLVNIHSKEGNRNAWQQKMTVSPLLGKFMMEGPLIKQKTSLMLSGRSSWVGLLFDLLSSGDISQKYLMYDVNAKITHHFNSSNRLYASYYSSLDDSSIDEVISGGSFGSQQRELSESSAGVKWGNQTASLRYVSFIGKRWVGQSIFYYTKYNFEGYNEDTNVFVDGTRTYSFTSNRSSNQDLGWKALMSYNVLQWKIDMGLELVKQKYQPQSIFDLNNSSTNTLSNNTTAVQQNYFFDLSFQPDSLLTVNAGVRLVAHHAPDTVFYVAEPRVKVIKQISPQLAANFSANYGHQYLHLLTGGNAGLTNEIWLGSTRNAPPQRGWQTTVGLGWASQNKAYAIEAEGFYKAMDNLTEVKSLDNNELANLSDWEELIEVEGEGKAYGAEFMLRKQTGKLTGWLAYTWSKSTRRFSNINRGNWFPFRFDRRHDISAVFLFALSEKWNLAATWGYQTGSYITLPVARIPDFTLNDNDNLFFFTAVDVNANRNNVRLPAYHRMDLSATYTWDSKKRGNQSSLSFSIYNAYNRINPYYIRTEAEPVFDEQGQYLGFSKPKVVIVGLFPFIPSVSFSRDFGYGSK